MTFEEYLVKKRINKEAFAAEDPTRYRAWEGMYAQMHPNSFYVAVKMVLNNVRLRYHLREEDVPKPTTTPAPRPAARRAAAPTVKSEDTTQVAIPEVAAAIPGTADVPQETTEEKPVTPAAAKPRPVVLRPAAIKPAVEGGETTPAEKPAEEAAKPAAPRARPVIKRPAALSKPEEQPISQKQEKDAIPEQSATNSEVPTEAPKPARPRPVIKRPAALQNPQQDEDKPNETPTAGIEPTSGAAAAETSKPPRPRPVIKRPTALQQPTPSEAVDKPLAADAPQSPANAESPGDIPKPPRPRPVIKRPAVLAKPAASAPDPSTSGSEEAKPTADGAATAQPAGEVPTDENKPAIVSAAASGIEQPAKPPRPRPIIRRPTPPAAPLGATQSEDEKNRQEAPSDSGITDKPSVGDSVMPEEQSEKPKPPRPRPIIRRPPPKTEE